MPSIRRFVTVTHSSQIYTRGPTPYTRGPATSLATFASGLPQKEHVSRRFPNMVSSNPDRYKGSTPFSSLQRRRPVDQQCDGRSSRIGARLVEKESLAVRRDDVLITTRNGQAAGLETGQEKRSGRSRSKAVLGCHRHCHQLLVRADEEQLSSVGSPLGLDPAM
jgi:hypothetical protein